VVNRAELGEVVAAVLEAPRTRPDRWDTIMRAADEYAITMHRQHLAATDHREAETDKEATNT
jgi:hypothetical protein